MTTEGARRANLISILLFAVAGASHGAEQAPDSNLPEHSAGGEWPSYNKTLDGQRWSPLTQINTANAANLGEVCRYKVADSGSLQAGPIVIDNVMYLTTATDTLAMDPTNCKVLWRHRHRRDRAAPFPVNRGVAY
jgi:glucose dehydrogenase